MASSSEFPTVAIKPSKSFSWVFCADWLLLCSIVICIMFYFNRFIGLAFTTLLRWTVWRSQKVKIDVQSIKFSFLTGRVFFKNLTVVDKDQAVCALKGSLTWRYWFRNVRRRKIDLTSDEEGDIKVESNSKLPSRLFIEIDGLEVFIYNRTVSYDSILQNIAGEFENKNNSNVKAFYDVFSQSGSDSTINPMKNNNTDFTSRTESDISTSFMTRIFPIQLKVNKGAIVAGNKTTQTVLILSYEKMNGVIDIKRSTNSLDHGCQSYELSLQNLEISLKPNVLYELTQNNALKKPSRFSGNRWKLFRQLLKFSSSFISNEKATDSKEIWKGILQYLDSDNTSNSDPVSEETEYGKYTSILSANLCDINYYYDFPGLVSDEYVPMSNLPGISADNIASSPEFGLDIALYSATIHYGPWADRQRHSLQQMMFPIVCRDGIPEGELTENQKRICTHFKTTIEIKEECILRIPTREPSKDDGHRLSQDVTPNSIRPFGWIELKVTDGSRISSTNALVASNAGYENKLDVKLLNLEARSSVNHDIFLRSAEHVISADIGYPLGWNELAVWNLLNESKSVEIFLLREHITLLSDLFTDFGSGPLTPYELFRPFSYNFNWKVNDYKLYFNVNDANIVNNPLDFNDNIYLSIQGEELRAKIHIPLDSIAKNATTIDYAVETSGFSLVLDTPPWHTLNNFLKSKELGRSKTFTVNGSYTYYTELSLDNVETIIIACQGSNVVMKCYGFIIKYIMSIKENYFGDFTRFKTLEEYTNSLNENTNEGVSGAVKDENYNLKRTENETDVHFSFGIDDSCIILPANLYDATSNISLLLEDLDMDIRFTNYYMDMQVDMTPVKGYYFPSCDSEALLDLKTFVFPETHELSVSGLNIHGHRMIGLPPDEPTYFCKWDITPGEVDFIGSPKSFEALVSSLIKLEFGYKNLENQLLLEIPELFDTTSLNVVLPKLSINLKERDIKGTVTLEIKSLIFKFINYANSRYTKRISIDIEGIRLLIRDLENQKESLNCETSLRFTNFCLNKNYEEIRVKKENHIIKHDGPFHRVPFLLDERIRSGYNNSFKRIIPSFSLPDGNPALVSDNVDLILGNIGIEIDHDDISIYEEDNSYDFIQDFDQDKDGSKKSYWESVAGVHFKPISFYDDEDFKPLFKLDPNFETNNLILNVGDIDGRVSIESLFTLLEFCKSYSDKSILSMLDDLHLAALKRLNERLDFKSICFNIRFVAPAFNLSFTEKTWDSENFKFESVDHLQVTVKNPSVVFSRSKDSSGFKEKALVFHFQFVNIKLIQGNSPIVGLEAILEDFEIWSHDLGKVVTSVTMKSSNLIFDPASITWIAHYVANLRVSMNSFVFKLKEYIANNQLATAKIFYQIAMGSIHYKIEHDPAVITRRAYIIRLSKKHIRANDSWKVITKLRHIFECLPESWLRQLETRKAINHLNLPPTAMRDVIQVFTQWRSWEFTDIAHSFIFRYIFESKFIDGVVSSITKILVESLNVSVRNSTRSESSVIDLKGIALLTSLSANEEASPSKIFLSSSFRVETADANLKPLTYSLELFDLLGLSAEPSTVIETVKNSLKEHQIVVSFGCVNFEADFHEIKLVLRGKESISSVLVLNNTEGDDLVLNFKLSQFQFSLYYKSYRILHHVTSQFKSFFVKSSTNQQQLIIDISSELSTFDCINSASLLACFIESLAVEIISLSKLANKFKLLTCHGKGSKFNLTEISLAFRYKNKLVKWNIPFLDLFIVRGTSSRLEMVTTLSKGVILSEFTLSDGKATVEISKTKFSLVESLQEGLALSSKFSISKRDLELGLNLGSSSILVADIFAEYHMILETFGRAPQLVSSFIKSMEDVKSLLDIKEPASTVTSVDPFLFNFKSLSVSNKSLVIGLKCKTTLFSLSLNHVLLNSSQIIFDGALTKPHGELIVESTQFSIVDKRIETNQSKILDFNFGLKLLKPLEKKQTLQLESSYSRLVLSSGTVVKLIQLKNDISHFVSRATTKNIAIEPKNSSDFFSFADFFKFSSIHILSYNVCAGFIFDDPTQSSPGLVVGCEKLFAISELTFGKMSLINSFFSLAKGRMSQDFFTITDKYDSSNRAFLPNMQITYAISKSSSNKDVQIRVTGEELDVKFIASSIIFIEQLLKSIATIEYLKQTLPRYPKVQMARFSSQESYVSLPPDVTSIECEMNFAGGVVKMFRWEDFGNIDNYAPSFELRAPAVKILASYSKLLGLKEHLLNFDVYIFSSSNTLQPSCVSVLIDVWDCIKHLGNQSGPKYDPKAEEKEVADTFNYIKILSKFQVNFALHIDKQELILNCEPSAKVQAAVGIGSMDIRLLTNEDDGLTPLAGSISIQDVGVSLQHSFSRETSGSIGINKILFTIFLSGYKDMKFYGAIKCDKVSTFLNLKQLQDVNLFKDLWFPSSLIIGKSNENNKSTSNIVTNDDNLVLKFQRVSENKLVPWTIDFLIKILECKVDLGKSLGMLSLDINKIWATSRKKSDREQEMIVGFNFITFRSSGRLSGHLLIRNIRLHSIIQWSMVGDTYEVPIVLLSIGFDSVETKSSFDYNVFMIGRMSKSHITVFNQVDKGKELQDALFAGAKCESIEIYITTFAASNILDVYNTLARIRQDNKRSYRENLKTTIEDEKMKKAQDIIDVIATLQTDLDVDFGSCLLHVYPSSFLDSQVLVVDIGGLIAHFEQKELLETKKLGTTLRLQIHDINVSLPSCRNPITEETLNLMTVEKFVQHSKLVKGYTIFSFPSLGCLMKTFSSPDSSVIEYIYKSSFGGKVDIRWNLGSIQFIREMWMIHTKALLAKLPKDNPLVSLYKDESIEEKIKVAGLADKYTYIAIEPPVIDAPRLRDLGDATPPLEWFGLHRQKFPCLTHQLVIVFLQKLVHEVELHYGRVLGKA